MSGWYVFCHLLLFNVSIYLCECEKKKQNTNTQYFIVIIISLVWKFNESTADRVIKMNPFFCSIIFSSSFHYFFYRYCCYLFFFFCLMLLLPMSVRIYIFPICFSLMVNEPFYEQTSCSFSLNHSFFSSVFLNFNIFL